MKRVKRFFNFMKDEKGIGVVEMILILVVLIGLIVIFKSQLTTLIGTIFKRIAKDSAKI